MLLQSYFPFTVLNRQTIFSKKFSYSLRFLFSFTKIFVSNDGQITEGENNLFEESIANGIVLFQKTCAFNEILCQ